MLEWRATVGARSAGARIGWRLLPARFACAVIAVIAAISVIRTPLPRAA
jgi:hypothetical protein